MLRRVKEHRAGAVTPSFSGLPQPACVCSFPLASSWSSLLPGSRGSSGLMQRTRQSIGRAWGKLLPSYWWIMCRSYAASVTCFHRTNLFGAGGETPQLITSNNTIKTMRSKLGYFIFLQQALGMWLEELGGMTALPDKPFLSWHCWVTSLTARTKLRKSKLLYLVLCTTPKCHI